MTIDKKQTSAMELLAPAGSFAAFQAAMEEGADAIYIGAPSFNARTLSRDFSYSEINAIVQAAHSSGVKVYIAMNSLIKENEIGMAVDGLAMFEKIRPDALIIQDLGLFWLVQKFFPDLPLHASTLMSVHNSLAVQKMTELGFKRIVLPRELTLEEIKDIYEKTGAELEVFVHGAMCFSYSGLCLFSSMFGGKSSLRGQCVQPCRRLYSWQRKKGFVKHGRRTEKDGGYLFSMHDLTGIELLPQLQTAGVSCLKIEGRLKSAEYVRKTVRAYRMVLDNMHETALDEARIKEAQVYLDEAMGRRRSTGFFLSSAPQDAVTPGLSGNIGIPAGKILKIEEKKGKGSEQYVILKVELKLDVQVGDRLRLHDENSGERTAFNLRVLKKGNRPVKKASKGEKVQIAMKGKVAHHRIGSFMGSLFKIDIGSGKGEEKRAKDFILKRKVQDLRRDKGKVEHILKEFFPRVAREGYQQRKKGSRLPVWVMIQSLRDRQFRLPMNPEKYIVPLDNHNIALLRSASKKLRSRDQEIIWGLPPILMENSLPWYKNTLGSLIQDEFTEFQLGHPAQVSLFDTYISAGKDLKLYAHYSCNILNSAAARVCTELHFSGHQFSLETDAENLEIALIHIHLDEEKGVFRREKQPSMGMYVFGHPPLFTARLDDSRFRYGKRFVSPKGEIFALDRSDGLTRISSTKPFSLLDVRQELAVIGIDYLVIDMTGGNIKRNLSDLDALFSARREGYPAMSGNYKTGLL